MRKLLVLIAVTAGSALGWWTGAQLGLMTAFWVSLLGAAAAGYAARRFLTNYT